MHIYFPEQWYFLSVPWNHCHLDWFLEGNCLFFFIWNYDTEVFHYHGNMSLYLCGVSYHFLFSCGHFIPHFHFLSAVCGLWFCRTFLWSSLLLSLNYEMTTVLWCFCAGFSDPYCLLSILEDEEESRTRRSRSKPCKSVVKDTVSDDKICQTDIKKQTLNPIWNQTFILWV